MNGLGRKLGVHNVESHINAQMACYEGYID